MILEYVSCYGNLEILEHDSLEQAVSSAHGGIEWNTHNPIAIEVVSQRDGRTEHRVIRRDELNGLLRPLEEADIRQWDDAPDPVVEIRIALPWETKNDKGVSGGAFVDPSRARAELRRYRDALGTDRAWIVPLGKGGIRLMFPWQSDQAVVNVDRDGNVIEADDAD